VLDGGSGRDKVNYYDSDAAVIMQLIGLNTYGVTGGYAEGDVLVSIEEIIGTRFDDILFGTVFGDNALEGREGNDALTGFFGDDLLLGGPGADILVGGGGANGASFVSSWAGVRLDLQTGYGFGGDAGRNVIDGLAGVDNIDALDGDDIILGSFGADNINGGRDRADFSLGFAVTVSLAGAVGANDIAQGDVLSEVEDLTGTVGADNLTGEVLGDSGDNTIEPGPSRDARLEQAPDGQVSTTFDVVDGLTGVDTMVLDSSRRDTGLGMTGGLTGALNGQFVRRNASDTAYPDGVDFSNIENFVITGAKSDDDITLGAGDDFVNSGTGTDIVLVQEGDDEVLYAPAALPGNNGTGPFPLLPRRPDMTVEPGPFWLDGGDTLSLDFSAYEFDLQLIGPTVEGEFEGVNLVTPEGGVAERFERFGTILTGFGADLIQQDGDVDNQFYGGDNEDVLRPGLVTDLADGGRGFVAGVEMQSCFEIVNTINFGQTSITLYEYLVVEPDFPSILQNEGDLLSLDCSGVGSAVTGMTELVDAGVLLPGLQAPIDLQTNQGTHTSGDGVVDLTFRDIERIVAIATEFGDILTGTYDTYQNALSIFDGAADFGRGDDILLGGAGNAILIGGDPSPDGAFRVPGRISSADPTIFRVAP
jgi:hypothetical protein